MRSAANAADTSIHLTTQLVRGRFRDALCAACGAPLRAGEYAAPNRAPTCPRSAQTRCMGCVAEMRVLAGGFRLSPHHPGESAVR